MKSNPDFQAVNPISPLQRALIDFVVPFRRSIARKRKCLITFLAACFERKLFPENGVLRLFN